MTCGCGGKMVYTHSDGRYDYYKCDKCEKIGKVYKSDPGKR